MSQNSKQFRANIMLLIVTGIWGGTFPLIKNSLNFIRPGDFVSVRFALATCAMLPFVMHRLNKTNRTVLIHGFVLGALNYVGYYAQTLSLKTQSSANSAFITALYVIIVPLLNPIFNISRFHLKDIFPAFFALLGVVVITGAQLNNLSIGHIELLLSAFFFALAIIYLHKITQLNIDIFLLAFYQILFIFFFSLFSFSFRLDFKVFNYVTIVAIIWCGLFSTCLTIWIQTYYQRFTTTNQAAIIYTFEPIFTTLIAYFFNSELVPGKIIMGGSLIIIALFLSILISK